MAQDRGEKRPKEEQIIAARDSLRDALLMFAQSQDVGITKESLATHQNAVALAIHAERSPQYRPQAVIDFIGKTLGDVEIIDIERIVILYQPEMQVKFGEEVSTRPEQVELKIKTNYKVPSIFSQVEEQLGMDVEPVGIGDYYGITTTLDLRFWGEQFFGSAIGAGRGVPLDSGFISSVGEMIYNVPKGEDPPKTITTGPAEFLRRRFFLR